MEVVKLCLILRQRSKIISVIPNWLLSRFLHEVELLQQHISLVGIQGFDGFRAQVGAGHVALAGLREVRGFFLIVI